MKFALISEGPSEHRIIKHIISKYFKDYDPDINQIQPKLVDGKQDPATPGGWNEVLKYCERDELKDILIENDFLIIQIDTDQSQSSPFNISHTNQDSTLKTSEILHSNVTRKLTGLIRQDIKGTHGDRILFAICIHTIECWLLPLFYRNNQRTKTQNCIDTLNTSFRRNNIHIITTKNKNKPNGIKAYETALKRWRRKQDIHKYAQYNVGFQRFIDSLETIQIESINPC
jgi:hypothetical protein